MYQIPKLLEKHHKHIESLQFMIENIRTSNQTNRDIREEFLRKEILLEETFIEELLYEKEEIKSLLERFLTR